MEFQVSAPLWILGWVLVFAGVALCVYILETVWIKQRDRIWAAYAVKPEPGVTLLECIRAYYLERGDWELSGEFVRVTAVCWDRPRVDLRVNLKTGEIETWQAGEYRNNEQTRALLRAMAESVRKRQAGAW